MYSFQPFVFSESGKVRSTGSQSLLPARTHEISLTQILGNRHSVGISWLRNPDLEYEQITADKTGILLAPASSARGHAFSAFANTWFWIWKDRLMFNAGINAEYAFYSGGDLQIVRSVNMDGRCSLQWHAGKGWKMSVSGFYLSPLKTLTYRQSSFWGMDLNVTKKFRDRWSLTFGLGNLLHSKKVQHRLPPVRNKFLHHKLQTSKDGRDISQLQVRKHKAPAEIYRRNHGSKTEKRREMKPSCRRPPANQKYHTI